MADTELLAAALADRYLLERELGQGGMATVYLATDVRHQRRVAIKVLHQDVAAAMGAERFLKEIQLTAALQHPNILSLFDSGAAAGRVFYVMPFVEGETLRARLDRERQLPVGDALRLTGEVASALEYAHKRGIVHRDIKPENILLQDGRVLVADFGIALAAAEAGGGARLTQTGISLGTPQYMSPEQAMGERSTDARTDVFALGAVAYEMLTGEPPFSGPTVQAIVSKVLTSQPVPVDELRRNVPEAAAAAIMAALEKLPADRPASAEQFAQMLLGTAPVPAGRTSAARPKSTPPRSIAQRLLPWGLGITAGLALGVGLMAWRNGRTTAASASTSAPLRFLLSPADSVQLVAVCCGRMFALSPDGRTFVYQGRAIISDSTAAVPPQRLFRRDFGSLTPVALAGTEGATALSISPDGTQLAFVSGTKLQRVPMQGGAVATIATLPQGFIGGTEWRDNDHVLVSVQSTLFEASTNGGELATLLAPDSLQQQITGAAVLPGRGAIVFAYVSADVAPVLYVLAKGSNTPRRLMSGASPHYVPAWRALVINRLGRLLAYPFDPATGDTLGAGVQIADGITLRSPIIAHGEYDVAPNGTFITTRRQEGSQVGWSPTSQVSIRENGASRSLPLPLENVIVFGLQFSPNGKRLLMTVRNVDQDGLVYAYDLARNAYSRVTENEKVLTSAWTDGGDSVVFVERQGKRLLIRAADGSGTAREYAALPDWHRVEELSVRGDWVAIGGLATAGSTSLDIGLVKRGQTTPVAHFADAPVDELNAAISPDQRWIAYAVVQSGRREIYVSPFPTPTSRTVVSTAGGAFPVWSGDGRTLSYASADGHYVSVAFTPGSPPTFGPPRELYRRGFSRFWTISPDGTKLITIDTSALLKLLGLEIVVGLTPTF
jgi:serine/threonine-protein kinase